MKEMEYYIAELKECVNQNNRNKVVVDGAIEDLFRDLLISISDSYLMAYEENNLEKMKQLLEEQRKLRIEMTKELNKSADQILLLSAKIVDQYNIFNKITKILLLIKR